MTSCILLGILIAGILIWRVYQLNRGGVPSLYAAVRCLREHEPPGETRYCIRMLLSYALVVQVADSQGIVRRVSIWLFDMDQTKLALLLGSGDGSPAPIREGDRYPMELQRYVAANPLLRNAPVRVWAEYDELYGVRVIAERQAAVNLVEVPS